MKDLGVCRAKEEIRLPTSSSPRDCRHHASMYSIYLVMYNTTFQQALHPKPSHTLSLPPLQP